MCECDCECEAKLVWAVLVCTAGGESALGTEMPRPAEERLGVVGAAWTAAAIVGYASLASREVGVLTTVCYNRCRASMR
jgi:hypothetical protein